MSEEGKVRVYKCPNCGESLEKPKSGVGKVKCPSCGTECEIGENIAKNEEILAKANINSGFPHNTSKNRLHSALLNALKLSAFPSEDMFNKINVKEEKHLCIPAYAFECSASAPYTYEIGNVRQRQVSRGTDKNGNAIIGTESYTEWTKMNSNSNVSETLISSGNKQYEKIVSDFYAFRGVADLVDVEYLEFPTDVETLPNDYPITSSFDSEPKQILTYLLQKDAEEMINNQGGRGLLMSSPKIDKGQTYRICVGIYKIIYEYNGRDYTIYTSNDGSNISYEELPFDKTLLDLVASKKDLLNQIKEPKMFRTLGIVLIIAGIVGCVAGYIPVGIIGLIAGIGSMVWWFRKNKEYHTSADPYVNEIKQLEEARDNAFTNFCNAGKPLSGIYENLSGGQAFEIIDNSYLTNLNNEMQQAG